MGVAVWPEPTGNSSRADAQAGVGGLLDTAAPVLGHLTFDEVVLLVITVAPLLLVLAPLARAISGHAIEDEDKAKQESREAKAEIVLQRQRSVLRVTPMATEMEERAEATLRLLERHAAADERALNAVQHDVAGIAWELISLRSSLGAKDARVTVRRELGALGANEVGGCTRNHAALERARKSSKGTVPTRLAPAGHSEEAVNITPSEPPTRRAPSEQKEQAAEKVHEEASANTWADGPCRVTAVSFDGLVRAVGEPRPTVVVGPSGKRYAGRSLWGMGPADEPRAGAIRLVELRLFDPIILLTIGANCATMAWESPLDPDGTWKAHFIGVAEWVPRLSKVYLYIFTFELLSKVVAYGFVWDREAYLRDAWCQLDFLVVSLAWAPIFFPQMGSGSSAIRAFRALRPLRALKRVPGMPKLVGSVLSSIPKLANVLTLCAFIFIVFGIVGVQLFKGKMHLRCALPGWADAVQAGLDPGEFDTGQICAEQGPNICEEGATCEYFDSNPAEGPAHFDNIGSAAILILQCASFDAYTAGMYALMDVYSTGVFVYYVLIICIAGFFVVNLFLGVLLQEFIEATQAEEKEQLVQDAMEEENTRVTAAMNREAASQAIQKVWRGRGVRQAKLPRSCCDCAPRGGWRLSLGRIVTSDGFGHASTALVVINMVVMCCPYAGMTEEYAANLETAGTVITVIFMVEMALKLVGVGCTRYWRNKWNKLDGAIVIMSAVELGATIAFAGGGPNISFLRILRMLRVLRMLRLMRSWKGLYRICMTLFKALPGMANIVILFFLLDLIFALLGMQLFGGSFVGPMAEDDSVELPRTHFDYIGPAMLTVFIVMSGSWYDIMMGQAAVSSSAPMYFVAVLVVGTYLLLNIFITILLEQFSADPDPVEASGLKWLAHAGTKQPDGDELDNIDLAEALEERAAAQRKNGNGERVRVEFTAEEWSDFDIDSLHVKHYIKAGLDEELNDVYFVPSAVEEPAEVEVVDLISDNERALCLFRRDGWVRQQCTAVVANSKFDFFIIGLIIASSICLAMDSPRLDPSLASDVDLIWWLKFLNLIFTIAFTIECMLKVISKGLLCNRGAYLRDPWNVLDFFIVNISLLCLLADGLPQLQALRSLRTLRVLRPLRLLARDPGMRVIITALFKVMPSVLNVFGVMVAIMTVFGILSLQLLMDSFGSCTAEGLEGLNRTACLAAAAEDGNVTRRMLKGGGGDGSAHVEGTVWLNPSFGSFDSFGSAMLLLYIMSTGDAWEDVMFQGMDAVGPGLAPERNDFSRMSLFFVAWMFFGGFFALNLFVGTICDNFTRIKEETDGSATMTAEQQQWAETLKASNKIKAARTFREPEPQPQKCLFKLVTSSPFDMFIMAVIVANVLVMACDYWRMEEDVSVKAWYDGAMLVFSYIYYAEAILKISALRGDYFRDSWCRFDFFLVCTTLLVQFGSELLEFLPMPPMLFRVLRILRILRILRLLKDKRAKGLKDLLMTMVLSFPSLINVGSLLMLLIFMYSVLGVQLFTFVQRDGEILTDDRNFENMFRAFLLLFQALTGDDWSAMMDACSITPENSECSEAAGDCGSPLAAIPFFVSFQFLGSFVFLNLVVAVILENFTTLGNVNLSVVSRDDLENFREAWAEFDPDANHLIRSELLPKLLLKIPPPMGLPEKKRTRGNMLATFATAQAYCALLKKDFGLVEHDGEVRFQEVVDALVHRNLHDPDADLEPPDPERLKDPDVAKLIKARPVSGELDRARAEAELEQFEDKSRKFTKLLRWSAEQSREPMSAPLSALIKVIKKYVRKKQKTSPSAQRRAGRQESTSML